MRQLLLLLVIISVVFAEYDPLQDNLELGRFDDLYTQAKQEVFTSENARSYYYLGQAYAGQGRLALAENSFVQVFKYPYEASYGIGIAEYYEKQKNEIQAAATYARVLSDFPTANDAAERLGQMYFNQNKYQQTIDVCTRLVNEDPGKANPLGYYIGTSYFVLGDTSKALEYYDLAQAKGYVDPEMTLKIGYIKVKNGDTRAGVELMAKGITAVQKQQPMYMYTTLAEAYARLNQFDLAASAYKKALQSGNQPVQVYINYASNAAQGKNFRGIVDTLEPKVDQFEKSGDFLYYLASAYDNLGSKTQAATFYQKALDAGYQNKAFIKGRINAISNVNADTSDEEQ